MPVVAVRPCLPIEPGHVAEARRALHAQGKLPEGASDAAVAAYLWTARALPVVLDALADAGAAVPLGEAAIAEVAWQTLGAIPAAEELVAVGVHHESSLVVEVRVHRREALDEVGDLLEAPALLVLRFGLRPPGSGERAGGGGVNIHRFVVGRG